VRWGRLYRSEQLSGLSEADIERLRSLGLGCICDFRSATERLGAPDRLPEQGDTRVVFLEIDQRALVSKEMAKRVLKPAVTAEDFTEGMRESYRRMVSHCTDQFTSFMQLFRESSNLPILIHCVGGKDRSGFAAALLLSALGVPHRTVFQDYLLTNKLVARRGETDAGTLVGAVETGPEQSLTRPLFVADRSYLQASFAEIDRLYGSFDCYLQQGLSFTPQQRESLRRDLLE